jgi:enamine deaminase RidA (YjgF/YER057c/UK114 family)
VDWTAGHGAWEDGDGNSLAGDFAGQTRASFRMLEATLERPGATLQDMVTMTVFVLDARHSKTFTDVRKAFYPSGDYPGSALITCAGLAHPDMMVEIQGIAVLGDD